MLGWAQLASRKLVASVAVGLAPGLAGALSAAGCGSSPPREADIFHDPSLRAGVVEASTAPEQQLLAQLAQAGQEPVTVPPWTAEPPYYAASGRRCRRVQGAGRVRLACEATEEPRWVFVPDVLEGDVLEGDVLEGDVLEGDVLEGDVLEGDVPEGDVHRAAEAAR